jgi:hypothetical protein
LRKDPYFLTFFRGDELVSLFFRIKSKNKKKGSHALQLNMLFQTKQKIIVANEAP